MTIELKAQVAQVSSLALEKATEKETQTNRWLRTLGIQDVDVEKRIKEWAPLYELPDAQTEYLFRQMVLESVQMDYCYREEESIRRKETADARARWDQDRGAEVSALVAKLSKNPSRWQSELLRNAQGVRWLIAEWKALRLVLETEGSWDKRQRERALDILGVNTMYRNGRTTIDPPPGASSDWLLRRVDEEIARLTETLEENLESLDDFDRDMAMHGLDQASNRTLQSLRRFESGCKRRFWDLLNKLDKYRVDAVATSTSNRGASAKKPTYKTAPPALDAQATMLKQLQELEEAIDLLRPVANKTERSEIRNEPLAEPVRTDPDQRKSRPAPPTPGGNRRQRRKAAALARKGK